MSPILYNMINREDTSSSVPPATPTSLPPGLAMDNVKRPKAKVKLGPVIGIAIACVVILTLIAVLGFCYLRARRRRRDLAPPAAYGAPPSATPSDPTKIKNSTDQVSLSSPHYLHSNGNKPAVEPVPPQMPMVVMAATSQPPVPISLSPRRPSVAHDGTFDPAVGGFALAPAPNFPTYEPAVSAGPGLVPDPAAIGRPPASFPSPPTRDGAAPWPEQPPPGLDSLPPPPPPLPPQQEQQLGGTGHALMYDLKQRPLPEPPRQVPPPSTGTGNWI